MIKKGLRNNDFEINIKEEQNMMDLLIAGDTTDKNLYAIIFLVAAVVLIIALLLLWRRKNKNKD